MKKRIVLTLVAAVAAIALMGCGITTTSTYTETVTDENGNTTSTTTTTSNGKTTTETTETKSIAPDDAKESEPTVATVSFDNQTDFDIVEMYFASASADNWGDNILANEEPLEVGQTITYNEALTYSSDNTVWDMKVVDAEGNNVEFNGADMTVATDPENIHITFIVEEAGQTYTATIE